ncbi:30107_t:CDS:2, partial [Gigaspora margarita]
DSILVPFHRCTAIGCNPENRKKIDYLIEIDMDEQKAFTYNKRFRMKCKRFGSIEKDSFRVENFKGLFLAL